MRRRFHPAWSILLVLLGACASTASPRPTRLPLVRPLPAVVTDATYPDVQRAFLRADAHAPERADLRTRLATHVIEKADVEIGADRYTQVADRLAEITALYTPEELAEGAFPETLSRIAQYLIVKGSPRGDEARVLSGYLVMRLLHPEDSAYAQAYEKLVGWGIDSRADMSGPLESYVGLVEAWEEHARLLPTPEVNTMLVRLYAERRNALVMLFQSSDEQVPLSPSVFQGVQRTAFDVAAVHLRHGDVASALTQMRALGPSGGIENKLGDLLSAALEDGDEGAGALLDLSRAYLEGARPDVSRALCGVGLRTRADDARFPRCLARVAAIENDYSGALAWYADAIALVPEERALYDEILEVLGGLITQGAFDSHAANTGALAVRATEILKERMRRWSSPPPPIAPAELYAAIAIAAMNGGDAKNAEDNFLESLKAQPGTATYSQYGLLLERVGRPKEATDAYKKALELVTDDSAEDDRKRAELNERLGDALRESGDREGAGKAYEKALALWQSLGPVVRARRGSGASPLRRGVLLGRLGRVEESKVAFREAMDAAPASRETYATILAYLAVSPPDAAFAHEVFRGAQNQIGLSPEWKVYFALWLRMISGRAGASIPSDVDDVLQEHKKGDAWWSRLARFGSGAISYDELLESTTTLGERAEAYFYEGARRLGANDVAGASTLFSQVLQTQMVSFFEYAMAQELLATPVTLPAQQVTTKAGSAQLP